MDTPHLPPICYDTSRYLSPLTIIAFIPLLLSPQTLAPQANIQTDGVQGTVTVSGQGKVYGTAVGVIASGGTVTGTYTFNEGDEKQGKDGGKG